MDLLRVSARLSSPIVSSDGLIHLDAVLEWAERRRRRSPACTSGPETFDIPVARHGGDQWVWRCSDSLTHWWVEDLAWLSSRFPFETARYLRAGERRVNTTSGVGKGVRLPLPCVWSEVVEWCLIGDKAGIESLLGRVSHLGKKHNTGWGKVREWIVESTEEDETLRRRDGSPARRLPLDAAPALGVVGTESFARVRPPYWHPEGRMRCLVPAPLLTGVR